MANTVALRSKAQGPLVRAVIDVTANMSAELLKTAEGLRLVVEKLASSVLPSSDPLAKARLRGVVAMHELLAQDGGALSSTAVAKLLHISRQAVDKRRRAGQLLAVELPRRGLLYPAWQFGQAGEPLVGFTDVLEALASHDPWAQARFFVVGNDRLGGKRALDVLRESGPLEPVLAAARAFGEHGAA